ncbi:MAG TPA: hypothetical protein VLC93_20280, partial [Myxococcota bacterium]|nr:hypothetical protein [Myxococcota bacterium]
MVHWRYSALFLLVFGVGCDGAVEGPNLDDEQTDEQTDQDTIDLTDQDQQATDTDTNGGDTLLSGDGGDGGDSNGGDGGGDSIGGGDDEPPTDDDPPPPTPVATTLIAISDTTQSALAGTAVGADPEVEVR